MVYFEQVLENYDGLNIYYRYATSCWEYFCILYHLALWPL